MNSTLEQTSFEEMTKILRRELEEYGALLDLLVKQQDRIMNRDPDALFKINEEVEAQMATNQGFERVNTAVNITDDQCAHGRNDEGLLLIQHHRHDQHQN